MLTASLEETPRFGFVVLALCSADVQYYVDDVYQNLVEKPTWRLTLRGKPLVFKCTSSCQVGDNEEGGWVAPALVGRQAVKRRQDDWMELKACPNAPFAFEKWAFRKHENQRDPVSGMFGMDAFQAAPLVE